MPGQFIADRIRDIQQSEIRNMTRECARLEAINLGQGLGDLPTPPLVADGAIQAIRDRHSTYSFPEGSTRLRNAIAAKLKRDNGIDADPEGQIVVTVGSTGAFALACMALLNPGDGILLPEPYYGYHLNQAKLAGLRPQFLPLAPPSFALVERELRAAITPETRALMLCTPSNPSGKLITREELEMVDRVAREHDLLVITDEIYEYIVYDGRKHISPATVGSLGERTVSIMGFSKTFSITGWRMGYAVAPREIAHAMNMANDLFYVCAATPLQHGVANGLEAPPEFYRDLAADYQRKRDTICAALNDAGLTPIVPQGAYYVLADVSHLGFETSKQAAMALLEETRVASIPGSAFYQSAAGEGLLRFCFAKSDEELGEAARRIRTFRAATASH